MDEYEKLRDDTDNVLFELWQEAQRLKMRELARACEDVVRINHDRPNRDR